MKTSDLVARYLAEKAPVWTPRTLYESRRGLQMLIERSADQLTREDVLSFLAWAKTRPLGAMHRPLCSVRAFLRWAYASGHLLSDLSAGIRIPSLQNLPRILSEDQVKRLIECGPHGPCARRDRAILEVLYGTGLRISELLRLDLGEVSLAEGLLFVREGKGRKDRVVPFGARVRDAIAEYLRHERAARGQALFLSWSGERLTVSGAQQVIRKARARAGVKTATAHRLRHCYATHLIRHGAGARHVQLLLGHASLVSTAIYLDLDLGDLKDMLTRCHPREQVE